jgi:hypothetical protein
MTNNPDKIAALGKLWPSPFSGQRSRVVAPDNGEHIHRLPRRPKRFYVAHGPHVLIEARVRGPATAQFRPPSIFATSAAAPATPARGRRGGTRRKHLVRPRLDARHARRLARRRAQCRHARLRAVTWVWCSSEQPACSAALAGEEHLNRPTAGAQSRSPVIFMGSEELHRAAATTPHVSGRRQPAARRGLHRRRGAKDGARRPRRPPRDVGGTCRFRRCWLEGGPHAACARVSSRRAWPTCSRST